MTTLVNMIWIIMLEGVVVRVWRVLGGVVAKMERVRDEVVARVGWIIDGLLIGIL